MFNISMKCVIYLHTVIIVECHAVMDYTSIVPYFDTCTCPPMQRVGIATIQSGRLVSILLVMYHYFSTLFVFQTKSIWYNYG